MCVKQSSSGPPFVGLFVTLSRKGQSFCPLAKGVRARAEDALMMKKTHSDFALKEMYPFVEGRSSFSWEYGMDYFSTVAPEPNSIEYKDSQQGWPSIPSYAEEGREPIFFPKGMWEERTQDLNPMEIWKYFLYDEDPIEVEDNIKPADPEEEGITVVMTKGGKISIPSFSFSKKS
ncbi:hypothetical protein RJT34_01340 [Clitoria ternatea]|uniref:Uncharacterized protein n=1 Tax=Clitoria ternatea TaxID=43366 RepID=A0AAN9KHL8_CLITE